MKYVDSGYRDPAEAVATWLGTLVPSEVSALRIQSGYFSAEPLGLLLPVFHQLGQIDAPTRVLIGSNDADTAAEDVIALIDVAGPPRSQLRLGIVHLAGGLFHPKVIHVECSGRTAAYAGSSNFSGGGLSGQNIEAGLILDSAEGDPAVVLDRMRQAIDDWFDGRLGFHAVASVADVERLLSIGVLTDKQTQRNVRRAAREGRSRERADGFRVTRLVSLPALVRESEATDARSERGVEPRSAVMDTVPTLPVQTWRLVWRSDGLKRRDLSIPVASGTNPTGSMGLKRGDWDEEIDHRHYFRDDVFASLVWTADGTGPRETAEAEVELLIGGATIASARITIAHNTDVTSRTYEQKNFMSALRWGELRPFVADERLLGQVLRLEREDRGDGAPPRFRIRIDSD